MENTDTDTRPTKIVLFEEVAALDRDCAVTETPDGESVLLLSEEATREVCLALDTLLDAINPMNTDQQEAVAYLYDEIMDRFAFERGSYAMLTTQHVNILDQALAGHTPADESAFAAVTETLRAFSVD